MAIDPNIKQKADDIRTKVYGSEVRESLASGLEAMSEDVVNNTERQDTVESQFQQVIDETTGKDVISAPEIIAARNGEPNLKARLDKNHNEVTAQLAQTDEHVDTISLIPHDIKALSEDPDHDNSQEINDLISNAPDGKTIKITGAIKANILVARSNINIIFDKGHNNEGSYIVPFDTEKPAIQIGDGVNRVRNVQINELSLRGTSDENDSNSVGLKLNGCTFININNFNVESFGGHNIDITSTTEQATSYVFFNGLRTSGSRQSNFEMNYGESYVTAIYISNLTNQTHTSNLSRAITMKGNTRLSISNGWIQGRHKKSIVVESGADGALAMNNVSVDSNSSDDILIELPNSVNGSAVVGNFTCDGLTEISNGVTIHRLFNNRVGSRPSMIEPTIFGSIYINPRVPGESDEYNQDSNWRIYRDGTRLFMVINGHVFSINGETGNIGGQSFSRATTPNRPTNPKHGEYIIDTTLKKLIWWDSERWVDAMGNIV